MESERVAILTVDRLPLSELRPHPRNPRKHPPEGSPAWEVLRRSLEHDYFDPLVWNRRNGMLVSGHYRLKVLVASGFTHADVSVVDYDDETHLARIVAANNLLGEFAGDMLSEIAREIEQSGIGTTMAAAEQTGRVCFACELDPKFCAVIIERMVGLGLVVQRVDGNGKSES